MQGRAQCGPGGGVEMQARGAASAGAPTGRGCEILAGHLRRGEEQQSARGTPP